MMIYLKSQRSDNVEDVEDASSLQSCCQMTEEDVEEAVLEITVTSEVEMVHREHQVDDEGQNQGQNQHHYNCGSVHPD